MQQAASLRCADYADTQRGPERGGANNEPGRENQCGTMRQSEERESGGEKMPAFRFKVQNNNT